MSGFQNDPGVTQQEGGFGFDQLFWCESRVDGITANPAGVQASATALTAMVNRVTTATAPGAAVALPGARITLFGLTVCVINDAANPITVFGGNAADTVNGTVGGVLMMAQSIAYFILTSFNNVTGVGTWRATGLGFGFATGNSSGFTTYSTQTGITATPSGTQSTALLLTGTQWQITTVATSGDAVRLPPALPGMELTGLNNAAVNPANIFPSSNAQGGVSGGDKINALAQNAAFSLVITTPTIFYCFVVGTWITK